MTTSTRYERFLATLYPSERRRIEATVAETLAAWPTCNGRCRPLRSGLWEVRCNLPTRICRVIFTRDPEGLRILGGIIKKSGSDHEREIKHALSQLRRAAA